MNGVKMDKYILQYNAQENAYLLYSDGINILLSNDLTPMDPDYHERILVPSLCLLKEMIENKRKKANEGKEVKF